MTLREQIEAPGIDSIEALLDKATNGGNWRVRQGQGPDSFQPDGYRYVQFGPSEKAAGGLGTDQLAPADAYLIVAAVQYVRRALLAASPEPTVSEPAAIDVDRLTRALDASMNGRSNIGAFRVAPESYHHAAARLIAAEYERLTQYDRLAVSSAAESEPR